MSFERAAKRKRRGPKLDIELLPRSTWGINLRSKLKKEDWDEIRKECYAIAGYRCEICGGVGLTHPVECHERWSFDKKNFVQKLRGTVALCPTCHAVKHIGRTQAVGDYKGALEHMMKVNKWSKGKATKYIDRKFKAHQLISDKHWRVDISWAVNWLKTQGGLIDAPEEVEA